MPYIRFQAGDYNNLYNKPSIPVNTSDLINNTGFATSGVLSGYTTEGYVNNLVAISTSGLLSSSGNGSNLTGILTSIVAGTNVTISGSTGQVTINASGGGSQTLNDTLGLGNTSNLGMSVGVITATSFSGSGTNLTGIVTSIVAGTNVTISGSTGQVTINASGGGGSGTLDILEVILFS
jgi:hypothetical protein